MTQSKLRHTTVRLSFKILQSDLKACWATGSQTKEHGQEAKIISTLNWSFFLSWAGFSVLWWLCHCTETRLTNMYHYHIKGDAHCTVCIINALQIPALKKMLGISIKWIKAYWLYISKCVGSRHYPPWPVLFMRIPACTVYIMLIYSTVHHLPQTCVCSANANCCNTARVTTLRAHRNNMESYQLARLNRMPSALLTFMAACQSLSVPLLELLLCIFYGQTYPEPDPKQRSSGGRWENRAERQCGISGLIYAAAREISSIHLSTVWHNCVTCPIFAPRSIQGLSKRRQRNQSIPDAALFKNIFAKYFPWHEAV